MFSVVSFHLQCIAWSAEWVLSYDTLQQKSGVLYPNMFRVKPQIKSLWLSPAAWMWSQPQSSFPLPEFTVMSTGILVSIVIAIREKNNMYTARVVNCCERREGFKACDVATRFSPHQRQPTLTRKSFMKSPWIYTLMDVIISSFTQKREAECFSVIKGKIIILHSQKLFLKNESKTPWIALCKDHLSCVPVKYGITCCFCVKNCSCV